DTPKIKIFNPDMQAHGWESDNTVLVVLCPGFPFTTNSIRAELNRQNLRIHTIASCNLAGTRDASGSLTKVVAAEHGEQFGTPAEALMYFEITRHTDLGQLEPLKEALLEILAEVSVVVGDFPAMCERLQESAQQIAGSDCVVRDYRDEAIAFLQWIEHDNMTFLGYEYLAVSGKGEGHTVSVQPEQSLGLLRERQDSGERDLATDLERLSLEQFHRKQLGFSKSRIRARVHRAAYPDYVSILVFDNEGEVVGQHRFLGLYTSAVYTTDPQQIPILRRKMARVLELSEQDWSAHERRELVRVIQLFPRDELFQSSIEQLRRTVNAVNGIQERRQTRLFVRRDIHGKFINCIVYVPRDQYNTEQRARIQSILSTAFQAQDLEFTAYYSESILVRCYFVLRVDPAQPLEFDAAELEDEIVQAMLAWEDRFHLKLVEEFGEEVGEGHFREFGVGFPAGYRDDFDPRVAVVDLKKILDLRNGSELAISLYRQMDDADNVLRLRLYQQGESLPLSDVLPILENLGLRVINERPYGIRARVGALYWVQEFHLVYTLASDIIVEDVREEFEDAFARIWFGEAESDSFNRLLLGTRLDWREIAMLRAFARYLRQLQFPYSTDYIAETLAEHLAITSDIVEMFDTRFNPDLSLDESRRLAKEDEIEQSIVNALESVPNLGQDRIIRQVTRVVKATQRSNFYQLGADGQPHAYFSFKLRPADIPDVPRPVPMFEIFVYSPRVEGVHLRGGKVARGGLRWSDRQEDFRTEVLGLVKAQQVKNAVIVPVGAKGGFVPRRLNSAMSRAEVQEEGIACYRIFIRGLLDITDNRVGADIVTPERVITKDEPDPYLVVAADKGTASFSDIANELSAEYGFWLADAFASGGSAGYDHKQMGITARGAWVSVQRHFREMGIDVQSEDFTVVGVGDMGGDVFGNGMLLSPHTQLVAAFNHLHIFLDPNPDPASSFAERQRLFEGPASGWQEYNTELISAGGGVFERSLKSITLSPEVRSRFAIDAEKLTPDELISHLLRSPVDLLWNGGIGTYVKSSAESNTDVGDKANDGLRVDATELKCRVIGEGGNLGMTQLGRVEYCLAGGRCNTDFIDNAGGVDSSDHEVNIKILLNDVVARGDLTLKQRNELLESITESVSTLVLKNNYRQTQTISLVEYQAMERAGEYEEFIEVFEEAGRLDRTLEFIPSNEELQERRASGGALTRPELSILVSYSKAALKERLMEVDLDSDPYLSKAALSAFPQRLVDEYGDDIAAHRLHREIVATQIANDIINRMGLNFALRQQKATGAELPDIARAYTAVLEIYRLPEIWERIELLDNQVPASVQMEMMLAFVRLVKRATRWLLRNRRREMVASEVVAQFSAGLEELRGAYPAALRGMAAEQFQELLDHFVEAGVDEELAAAVASAHIKYTALGIIQTASEVGSDLVEVANLYFALGERLELDWFAGQILAAKVENEWQALARDAYMEDLEWQQRTLAVGALNCMCEERNILKCLETWEEQESVLLERWYAMLAELHASGAADFAMLAVANRELLDLAQSSRRALGTPAD
ncbi:MAG: NAD-glutamate dehydrogenase, partial [Halioglobus sp.]